jgi:hypothetical protein
LQNVGSFLVLGGLDPRHPAVDLGKRNDTLQFGGNGGVRGGGVIANSATYLDNSGVDSVFNDTYGYPSGSFTGFEQMPSKIMPLQAVFGSEKTVPAEYSVTTTRLVHCPHEHCAGLTLGRDAQI